MDFFNRLGDAITETGRDVSQKVADFTGIAKLNMEIRNREETIRKQYLEIGKKYYELHREDQDPFFEEINLITENVNEIEKLKAKIADLKGKKRCLACGAVNEGEAVYCIKCGAKCESIFEEEAEEETKEDIILEPEFQKPSEDSMVNFKTPGTNEDIVVEDLGEEAETK